MEETQNIITALGAGSGINTLELANNLAAAQFQLRQDRLTQRSELLEQRISAASTIRNSLSLLASSLGDRVRVGDLNAQAQIADPSIASVSSPPGSNGSGFFSLEVTSLAASQVLASPSVASTADPVGAGTLTLRFGTVSGTSFTADTQREAVDITIESGSSLSDIAGAINASGAGVQAYIASTTGGPRLVIKGDEGAANGFVIEASETPGEEGLAQLAWNPASGAADRLTSAAADGAFLLDGLEYTSSSNRVSGVATGLDITLQSTNIGAPTQISFTDPTANVSSAMADLVSALNEVVSGLRQATNPFTGELRGDSGARNLTARLSGLAGEIVMPNAAQGAPNTLSDLGLAIQRDGTFRLDTERLDDSLARDPEAVAAMFTNGLFGVFATFDNLARSSARTGDPGSLAGSIERYERQAEEVSERSLDLVERQEALRSQLITRFARSDARVAASQATLSFLQQQIDAWNTSNS